MKEKKKNLKKKQTKSQIQKLKLMITVLNRGKAQKIIPLFEKYDVTLHTILLGRGTANSEILSYLGLAETSKDIVLSFVKKNKILSIYEELNPYLKRNGNGISFTIPLTSMVGMTMYKFLTKGA